LDGSGTGRSETIQSRKLFCSFTSSLFGDSIVTPRLAAMSRYLLSVRATSFAYLCLRGSSVAGERLFFFASLNIRSCLSRLSTIGARSGWWLGCIRKCLCPVAGSSRPPSLVRLISTSVQANCSRRLPIRRSSYCRYHRGMVVDHRSPDAVHSCWVKRQSGKNAPAGLLRLAAGRLHLPVVGSSI
jgi:hypothetical protein